MPFCEWIKRWNSQCSGWSEWFQRLSSPQSRSLSTFSPHFTHFLSETYSDLLSGPFSLRPMGFSYSVDLTDDGLNLQQTHTLTRSTIQWTRKVLTCMSAPTQNPPWRGGWQKKDTIVVQVRSGEMSREWVQKYTSASAYWNQQYYFVK